MPSSTSTLITPNYALSLVEVFAEATYATIKATVTLDVLFGARVSDTADTDISGLGSRMAISPGEHPGLYSWCVDFTRFVRFPWGCLSPQDLHHFTFALDAQREAAYGLSLSGRSITRISAALSGVVNVPRYTREPSYKYTDPNAVVMAAAEVAETANPLIQFRSESRGVTLLPGGKRANLSNWLNKGFSFEDACEVWNNGVGVRWTDAGKSGVTNGDLLIKELYQAVQRYTEDAAGGNALFTTTDGCIGTASRDVKKRDMLVLLDGARLPVVLRLRDCTPGYTFRGLACLHGTISFVPGSLKSPCFVPRIPQNRGKFRKRRFLLC